MLIAIVISVINLLVVACLLEETTKISDKLVKLDLSGNWQFYSYSLGGN